MAITSLGLALYEQKKFKEALVCYKRAAKLSPEDSTGNTSYSYNVSGWSGTLVFQSPDCTGTAYPDVISEPGTVICDSGHNCFYTDKASAQSPITPFSEKVGETCNPVSSGEVWRLPLLPNDKALTGIPDNGVFNGALTINIR